MVRLVAFALHADDQLSFAGGISAEDEPDLWRKDLTGAIDLWIEVGQPDEKRIRRACGRARQVVVYTYSGRGAGVWWSKVSGDLARCKNLQVFDFPDCSALTALAGRAMRLQAMLQDGELQLMSDVASAALTATRKM